MRRLDHLRSEDGIALVVAILLMFMMLSLGLAAIQLSDSQSQLTGKQRQRESSFNVAEAALNAQVTQIAHHWIGKNGGGATPTAPPFTPCPGGNYCPDSAELTSMIPSADTNVPVVWQTQVFDNSDGLETYYSDSIAGTQCGCDENDDGKVWVRAQATIRGHVRTIVSLVQQQMQAESVPHAAIIAGSLTLSNNGMHGGNVIIDTNGGLLAVRCSTPGWNADGTPVANEDGSAPCMGQPEGQGNTRDESSWDRLLDAQIDGFSTHVTGYQQEPVFAQDQIDRFLNTARAENHYYTSCPADLSGDVVVLDVHTECAYQGGGGGTDFNTQADPGFLILLNADSSLSLSGNRTFYGVVYHANMGEAPLVGSATQSSGTLITVEGNARIVGGVLIDGPGRIEAGSSAGANAGSNVVFDDHGYDAVQSFAGAGIIQNSWREINPGA